MRVKRMDWQQISHFFETLIVEAKEKAPTIRDYICNRGIGILSKEEQEKIRTTHIAILGIGGIGMPLLELLVRAGAETLTIVDKDVIDPTNINRVPWAFPFTFGQPKIEVAELFVRLINPNVDIHKFRTITSQNAAEVLKGVEVAALTLDGVYSSLVTAKYCRDHNIPLIEGWALAGIINARIFQPSGPSYEEVYDLKITKDYDQLTKDELVQLDKDLLNAISKINREVHTHFSSDGLRLMMDGAPRRSLSPFVWAISAILASELLFKVILRRDLPRKDAPEILLYDYLLYRDLAKRGQRKALRTQITEILKNNQPLNDKVNSILKYLL